MILFLAMLLMFGTVGTIETSAATFLLAFVQLLLLVRHFRDRGLTGAGAFLFMSFLFFGIRPIYILLENDVFLFVHLFVISVDRATANWGMWWATLGMILFSLGGDFARHYHHAAWNKRRRAAHIANQRQPPLVSNRILRLLLVFQLISLALMRYLGLAGTTLYETAVGAYLYDFPVLLQAGHIFTLVVIFERFLRTRSPNMLFLLGFSGVLFLVFTLEMRSITQFRGFYIMGLMAAGIALLARMKPRVGYAWLILPVILLLPPFRTLGEARGVETDEIAQVLQMRTFDRKGGPLGAYWHFFDSNGDMNIFDSFVAAKESNPRWKPYALSWLYVPVHFVPRAVWKDKPRQGILADMRFARGAPYSPGIAGFFLLDGGLLWMLGCMTLLGYIVGLMDCYVLTMPRGYLRCCLYGIIVVNAMFLSRFLLWQWFYQVLYAVIPVLFLSWLVRKDELKTMARLRYRQMRQKSSRALGLPQRT